MPDFLGISPDDARLPVFQGDAVMINEGPWFEGVLKKDEQPFENYDFFIPPSDHEPLRYSAFPEQWMIAANAKHPDEAAAFIDWMTQTGDGQQVPGCLSAARRWLATSRTARPRRSNAAGWRSSPPSQATYPPTDQAFVKELMDGFFEVQSGIASGQFTPEDGAKAHAGARRRLEGEREVGG